MFESIQLGIGLGVGFSIAQLGVYAFKWLIVGVVFLIIKLRGFK